MSWGIVLLRAFEMTSMQRGESKPPQGLCLLMFPFSTSNTSRPSSEHFNAEIAPAGPPPTMVTSKSDFNIVEMHAQSSLSDGVEKSISS